jgi:exonuclease III
MSDEVNGQSSVLHGELQMIDPDDNFFNSIFNSLDQPLQSQYYSVERFNSCFKPDDTFCIMNFNVRSFNANGDSFLSMLDTLVEPPDIIVITETWFDDRKGNTCDIAGYNAHHTMREGGRGGGVSVYTLDNYTAVKMLHLSVCNDSVESCVVKVRYSNCDYILIAIYRPHSDTIDSFADSLYGLLQDDFLVRKNIFLLGDFNADLLNQDLNSVKNLVATLQALHFLPTITKPTRFPSDNMPGNPTLLDHIWCNMLSRYWSGILSMDITDHCPTFICLFVASQPNEKVKLSFRSHTQGNIDKFIRELHTQNWNITEPSSVAVQTDAFIRLVDSLYCRCFPLKVKFIGAGRFSKPWLSSHLMQRIRNKAHHFKQYKLGLISHLQNRSFSNRVNAEVRKAKTTYYQSCFIQCQGNLKKTWGHIRKLLCRSSKKSSIKRIIIDDNEIQNELSIANYFSDFFSTVADDLARDLPDGVECPLLNVSVDQPSSFFLRPMTVVECSNVISTLKNTYFGRNTLPVKVLLAAKDILAVPISGLINNSFVAGIFPSCLKCACITPVFKAGDPTNITNYRPISVLPLFSKIFEKCMVERLINFAESFSLVSAKQFGFQRELSTSDAVIEMLEYIYSSLNDKEHCLSVFVDLRKAFDTVNHEILLQKMYRYGVRGLALDWFTDYLRDRSQRVRIGESVSDCKIVNIGVPQGSVLGPVLFLFYINDLPNVSSILSSILFADDTTLSSRNSNYGNLIVQTNHELENFYRWTLNNRLSVNVDKTFSLLFTNRSHDVNNELKVYLNGIGIDFALNTKFLGVILDSSLTFKNHIDHVCNKVSRQIGILYKLRSYVPEKVMRDLYYSLVHPYLIYCNLVWGGTSSSHLNKLFLLQKKIIRIITGEGYLSHTDPLFRRTNILKLDDLHTFQLAVYGYKLNARGAFTLPVHEYHTRNRDHAVPRFQRLTISQRALSYAVPHVWNTLPTSIKDCSSVGVFKKLLKNHLLVTYSAWE